LLILSAINIYSQDTTQSLAFKRNRPQKNNPYFYRPDLSYQLLQQFKLIQEANAGDALAQHELGIRLLLGEGIAADTAEAVKWIKTAADNNLSAASYNYGILLMNGLGVEWNPFEAFKYFLRAASNGMPQAQYVAGILYTDNLIINRNWEKAFYWIYIAKENGYKVDDDVYEELLSKVRPGFLDSIRTEKINFSTKNRNEEVNVKSEFNVSNNSNVEKSLGLSFIDFDSLEDTTIHEVKEYDLIKDLTRTDIPNILDTLKLLSSKSIRDITTKDQINILMNLSDNGSPEALTLIGKLYEEGIYFQKNMILAAEYYIRAIRYESFRAPLLLYKLTQVTGFNSSLQKEVKDRNPDAMFVWYGLSRFGFNNELVINEALRLLHDAADLKHIPSMIELGLNYYTGDYIQKNDSVAFKFWREAEESAGSSEATIRIIISKIFDNNQKENLKQSVESLINFAAKGSVIAQSALGYCYLNGIGVNRNKALAVKYFRLAAFRGNRFAYEQLKKLYDELRPSSPDFIIN
jgi:TPR repeat protein